MVKQLKKSYFYLDFLLKLILGAWDSRIRLAKKSFGLDDSEMALLTQMVTNEAPEYEGK